MALSNEPARLDANAGIFFIARILIPCLTCGVLAHVSMLQGWDKTYCLQFVEKDYDEIHFFGDKTFPVSTAPHLQQTCRSLVARVLSKHV